MIHHDSIDHRMIIIDGLDSLELLELGWPGTIFWSLMIAISCQDRLPESTYVKTVMDPKLAPWRK